MHDTIERLINGDKSVVDNFVEAKARWSRILVNVRTEDVKDLAARITTEQSWFERHCGGRWPGQEVMVWAAFASLYTTAGGFEENAESAKKLAKAFAASMCSLEVKSGARAAAESYGAVA